MQSSLVLESTFQLAPRIGPYRERQLWAAGVRRWDAFPPAPDVALSPPLDGRLRESVQRARAALAAGDAEALAAMLPRRERWRLYPAFEADAAFLDIETDGGELVTAVGEAGGVVQPSTEPDYAHHSRVGGMAGCALPRRGGRDHPHCR